MGIVTPDWGTLVWMLVSFLIVFFLLKRFAWKPILKMLQEREASINQALTSAESARAEIDKMQQENERIISEARRKQEQILKEARDLKDQLMSEAREQAIQEKTLIIEDARNVINKEKADAIQDIQNMVAEYSVSIAEKLLRRELKGDDAQKKLIEDSLGDIK